MTKPLIKLPSVELRETKEALDKAYAEIADKNAELANSKAEIARLKEMLLAQSSLAPQG